MLEAKAGDILLVQGDFGATYNMINFAKNIGIKPSMLLLNASLKSLL